MSGNGTMCHRMNSSVSADQKVKGKVDEKLEKYGDPSLRIENAVEHKGDNCRYGPRKGYPKCFDEQEIGGRIYTIQTTELFKSARIRRRILETCGDLLSLSLQ